MDVFEQMSSFGNETMSNSCVTSFQQSWRVEVKFIKKSRRRNIAFISVCKDADSKIFGSFNGSTKPKTTFEN